MSDPENSYTGAAWFGVGPAAGDRRRGSSSSACVLMLVLADAGRGYWQEKPSVAPDDALDVAAPQQEA